MIIRQQQIDALKAAALQSLENTVLNDLCRFWTEQVSLLGNPETRRRIRSGFECALRYGIDTQQGLYRFVNLMFLLGRSFDRELPWARCILEASELSGKEKLDQLVAAALDHPMPGGKA